ncbi:acyl-CoA reductase [Neobacillus niacini]|uniref:acyl-CoA reductase n=1 Tax=Neobacillus niacini TaxID=86668 RepID=UPI00052F58BE|nr:acyl-CoA reductase [Neobacillus niacini]KGM44769.1 acyl-CoA reductase [Neobacillus niacini]MEC1525471.1 acyl-CoA reductase [Neobacillus niacini]
MRERVGYLPDIGDEVIESKILTFTRKGVTLEVEAPLLTRKQMQQVSEKVKRASAEVLKNMTIMEIITIIDTAIEVLLDRNSTYRKKAEKFLPIVTGYDEEMIRLGLTSFLKKFRKYELQRFVVEDLGNPLLLDDFQPRIKRGFSKAVGPELILHVWAGNVPALPLWSLLSGLLVKSGNIGKVSSAEPLFAGWFAQVLVEVAPVLKDCLAVVWWKGGDEEREKEFFTYPDVVVGYGSNQSLESMSRRIPVTTRFLPFGHKVSFGVISNTALDSRKALITAHHAAFDIIQFDQQGCYSPHLFYVQKGGNISPEAFAQYLALELESYQKRYPRRTLSLEEMTAAIHWRNQEEISSYTGPTKLVLGQTENHWTVVYEEGGLFSPTCSNRAVKVIPFETVDDILPNLKPYRSFLQSAGVAAAPRELFQWAEKLGNVGVTRITSIGKMTSPESGWHHDGRFNLLDLVQMIDIEHSAEEYAENFAAYID